jgi:hypothetical protein
LKAAGQPTVWFDDEQLLARPHENRYWYSLDLFNCGVIPKPRVFTSEVRDLALARLCAAAKLRHYGKIVKPILSQADSRSNNESLEHII